MKCYHCSGWEFCPFRNGEECMPKSRKITKRDKEKRNEFNSNNKRNIRRG